MGKQPALSLAAGRDMSEGLQSDKEFLEALGLSEQEAAKTLGRSRQSLYQAELPKRLDYFKRNDVVSLLHAALSKTPDTNLSAVHEYIGRTRGPEILSDILAINVGATDEATLSAYPELWIVIPDLGFMSRKHPEIIETFYRLARRAGGASRFLVSDQAEAAMLKQALASDSALPDRTLVDVESWIGAIPYLIIGDPRVDADCFIFVSGKYMKHDWYGGRKLALMLQSLSRLQFL